MTEQTFVLGVENHLIATLTTANPSVDGAGYIAVLTNSGVIPRAGPHRMNVHLARRFAEMGIPSIRFDMSGLGDSQRASGDLPMLQQWVADTREIMDAAQARFGCDRFFMIGFCSGAEVAYLAALEDERMRAAVLWDMYAYPTFQSRVRAVLYRARRAGFKKLMDKAIGRIFSQLKPDDASVASDEAKTIDVSQVPSRDEFATKIQSLVDRGVEFLFTFCGGESVWFNYKGQFRDMFAGYEFVDRTSFHFLEQSDHLITRKASQLAFTNMVVDWLQRRVLPARN